MERTYQIQNHGSMFSSNNGFIPVPISPIELSDNEPQNTENTL